MKHLEILKYSRDVNIKYIEEWEVSLLWKMVAKTDISSLMQRNLYLKVLKAVLLIREVLKIQLGTPT